MTDEPFDTEVAEPEDPQLLATLRHRVQRAVILCLLVTIVPIVLAVVLTWGEPNVG
ncbi:hypothetical protein [Angustibacter luteus]|uniref:ABC transporter permease n=1 Tax=Angustibacter luteus TaxID=658456 RepID=A0ABW1JG48_9ACTN